MQRRVTECPVCDALLGVSELHCPYCEIRLQGRFTMPPLARLSAEHQQFIEIFVLCRGVIRDVEQALGISYPTVRARLDTVVAALAGIVEEVPVPQPPPPASEETPPTPQTDYSEARRRELLRLVESGDLDPTLAAEAIRAL